MKVLNADDIGDAVVNDSWEPTGFTWTVQDLLPAFHS